MKKRMRIMLIFLAVLFGGIFLYKAFVGYMMQRFFATKSNAQTVSTMTADYALWQPLLRASGNTRAIRGVSVTTQLAGMVDKIYFTPGSEVQQNALLVQLNADTDIALLHSLEANAELARITYERDKAQYAVHAVSKAQLDTDIANLKSLRAQVEQQKATVAKKTIRAPFAGRLGISQINPGQFLNPGDPVVMLQSLDPMYVDFYLPQQNLAKLKVGQEVIVTSDTFPGTVYKGKITTINPAVDSTTRNVQVEATIENAKHELSPGMYTTVEVILGEPQSFITLPQTAITFNPYGEIVYKVHEKGKDSSGKPLLVANQAFVTIGETRGDQVTVIKGLKKGEIVVTSGQLKLKNGTPVIINNTIQQPDVANPAVPNNS